MPILIWLFYVVQNNLKNLDKYIKDSEWAYTQDYQSAESSNNFRSNKFILIRYIRYFFAIILKKK